MWDSSKTSWVLCSNQSSLIVLWFLFFRPKSEAPPEYTRSTTSTKCFKFCIRTMWVCCLFLGGGWKSKGFARIAAVLLNVILDRRRWSLSKREKTQIEMKCPPFPVYVALRVPSCRFSVRHIRTWSERCKRSGRMKLIGSRNGIWKVDSAVERGVTKLNTWPHAPLASSWSCPNKSNVASL